MLHRHSEFGYTRRAAEALPHEPEAVPSDYQALVTSRSHRDAEQKDRRARGDQRAEIGRVIAWLDELHPAVDASREIRAARQAFARLDRRLAAS